MRGDLEWGTIPRLLDSAAARFAGIEAVVDGETRLGFTELAEQSATAARAAMAHGLRPGDRVAIWAPNIHEWVVAAMGALSAGGVLVPVNTRFKGAEARHVLSRSKATMLFTVTDFLGTDYVQLLADAGDLASDPCGAGVETTVVLRGPAPAGTTSWAGFLAVGSEVSPEAVAARKSGVSAGDVSDIIFTSGTTGLPKGAVVTHGQSLRVFAQWSEMVGLRRGDRYLVVNPFFHTFGYKAGILASLMQGATIVPLAVFDVDAVLATVAAERISVLPGPPTIYQAILNHPERDDYDLSSLRLAVTGAAAVPVEMINRMRDELCFGTILTAYGLTEATGTVSICSEEDEPSTVASTSGRALPGTEVRVVDDEGVEVPRGQAGEIVVRGYNVMQGYLDDPEATSETIDAGGWLHTGDVGTMDAGGYIAVTDRKKDMFIVGGFNAYPAEIENLLLGHPKIAQVAVVGVPDARLGEVGVAFVVPRGGGEVAEDEVISWARDEMANYKVPRRVVTVSSLPLNASGKVRKYELRERAAELARGEAAST